jgi:hypothetical protein
MMRLKGKIAAAAIATALAGLVLASAAAANTRKAIGEFAQFNNCSFEAPAVENCLYSEFIEGTLKLGAKSVPIVNPITLEGGFTGEPPVFFAADNGQTLSKTPQPVPGDPIAVAPLAWWPEWVKEYFEEQTGKGLTKVTVTMELAKPASAIGLSLESMLLEEGTGLGLPVKFKLSNAILGSNCYLESSPPIQLELTTDTSGSLTGSAGEFFLNPEATIAGLKGLKLVDNVFEAPAASGCGGILSEYFDPLVDSIFGLPAGSGESHVSLQGRLEVATSKDVDAHSVHP